MKEYIVMEMNIWIDDKTTKRTNLQKINDLVELVNYIDKKLDIYCYISNKYNIMHPIQNIESFSLSNLKEGVKKGYYIIYDN